jgi:hypothetical protein
MSALCAFSGSRLPTVGPEFSAQVSGRARKPKPELTILRLRARDAFDGHLRRRVTSAGVAQPPFMDLRQTRTLELGRGRQSANSQCPAPDAAPGEEREVLQAPCRRELNTSSPNIVLQLFTSDRMAELVDRRGLEGPAKGCTGRRIRDRI